MNLLAIRWRDKEETDKKYAYNEREQMKKRQVVKRETDED